MDRAGTIGRRTVYIAYGKRFLDLVLVLPAFVLVLPLLVVIAVLVWTRLGKPVLFRQDRPGFRGQLFTLYKFRTMNGARRDEEKPLPDEARLTPFGRFLRRSSLDELPELFNVIKGDMSLVGPRPLLPQYLERYTAEQARRHEAKPGLTGWAQINGRNALTWEEKFAMDVWYVDNRSFRLDLTIILKTISAVIRREGISAAGEATMPEFMGTEKSGRS